jgi:hypothetical protein
MQFNRTYNKFGTGKHLSDEFPIPNVLKQSVILGPLLSNFALE